MITTKTNLLPQTLSSQRSSLLRFVPLLVTACLSGCATRAHKEESIDSILQKENSVISHVKIERSEPTLCALLNGTSEMTVAEKHLTEALDAITRSNNIISQKLLSESGKEKEIERRNH